MTSSTLQKETTTFYLEYIAIYSIYHTENFMRDQPLLEVEEFTVFKASGLVQPPEPNLQQSFSYLLMLLLLRLLYIRYPKEIMKMEQLFSTLEQWLQK